MLKGIFIPLLNILVHITAYFVYLWSDVIFTTYAAKSSDDIQKTPEGFRSLISTFTAFFMTLIAFFHSLTLGTRKDPHTLSDDDQHIPNLSPNLLSSNACPTASVSEFPEADLISSLLQKLSDLEEKVQALQVKPSEMPCEKEELLNASIYRVDALEADLISTKKVHFLIMYIRTPALHDRDVLVLQK